MPPVISRKEKRFMYAITIIADALQLIGVETIIGGDFIDVAIGGILIWYGQKRNLFTPHKLMVLVATFAGEAIPIVNALPFWTLDLRNLYSGSVEKTPETEDAREPFYQAGRRIASSRPAPLNQNNVRLPRKSMVK